MTERIRRAGRLQFCFCLQIMLALVNLQPLPAGAASLVEAIKDTKRSVVAIGTYQLLGQPPVRLLGTGFIVADGGYVITNAHVLPKELDAKNQESLQAFYGIEAQAKNYELDVVAEDEVHDLALLRIIGNTKLPALSLSGTMAPEGTRAAITGYPLGSLLGLYPITHEGIISAVKERSFAAYNQGELTAERVRRLRASFVVYQIDTNAYPGNSGSPLYDPETRKVLGVVQSVGVRDKTQKSAIEAPTGFTFAVPARFVSELLARNNLPGY
jgi:serine protease Do